MVFSSQKLLSSQCSGRNLDQEGFVTGIFIYKKDVIQNIEFVPFKGKEVDFCVALVDPEACKVLLSKRDSAIIQNSLHLDDKLLPIESSVSESELPQRSRNEPEQSARPDDLEIESYPF